MEFELSDIIIVGLILFLSLKGIVSGFTKELFNFIGLVGGVALASRVNIEVGEFLSQNIFPLDNEPSLKLVGFVATLLGIWLVFTVISSMFDGVSSDEIGILSRILGYLLSIARYIAIFAIIIVGVGQSDYLSKKLSKQYGKSQLFPLLNNIGTRLLNNQDNNKTTTNTNDINLSNFKIDNNNSYNIKK
jgi:uncharacterized membrane protein required for colicin V production